MTNGKNTSNVWGEHSRSVGHHEKTKFVKSEHRQRVIPCQRTENTSNKIIEKNFPKSRKPIQEVCRRPNRARKETLHVMLLSKTINI